MREVNNERGIVGVGVREGEGDRGIWGERVSDGMI